MSKWVPISLWLLVLVLAIWVGYQRWGRSATEPGGAAGQVVIEGQGDGRLFIELPWRHLPSVGDVQLKDQLNQPFSTAAQIGRPMLVNFFFATCPTICRQFNGQMQELAKQYRGTDLRLLSLTVDPENDTPELLKKYAESFSANHEQWKFLTGQSYQIQQAGTMVFHVPLEKATHTEKIFLIDRWGKIRDWFDWNNAAELSRLKGTLDDVLAETSPPWGQQIRTRYALAGGFADRWKDMAWIKEFKLVDSAGEAFYSRDMEGQVWLASFFFTSCPTICPRMNEQLAKYQERLASKNVQLISITSDPVTDTPAVLREYATRYRAPNSKLWRFLTGDPLLIKRVGSEFFSAAAGDGHHSSRLFMVDRWGNVRGSFDWQQPEEEAAMWNWIDRLQAEERPPTQLNRVYP